MTFLNDKIGCFSSKDLTVCKIIMDSLFFECHSKMSIGGRAKERRPGERQIILRFDLLRQKVWLGEDKPLSKIRFLISYPF